MPAAELTKKGPLAGANVRKLGLFYPLKNFKVLLPRSSWGNIRPG